jgi:hypothetical protein
MRLKLSSEELISKFKEIHGDRYDYSKVDHKGQHVKVEIICKTHGSFFQTPSNHKLGQNCPLCNKKRKKDLNYFLEKAKEKHGEKYDYSKIKIFKNVHDKYEIICPNHGVFKQKAFEHLKYGCNECAKIQRPISKTFTTEKFIKNAKKIHGNRYDYSKVNYIKGNLKVEIICNKHGSFLQQPQNHVLGVGCSKCKMSRGEFLMEEFLKENKINYKYNFYNKECKNPKTNFGLYFDFIIPEYKTFIEVDGTQHYYKIEYWDRFESLKERQYRDRIKNKWCKDNSFKLIRINPNKIRKFKNKLIHLIKKSKKQFIKLL